MPKKRFTIWSYNHGKGKDYAPGFAEEAGFEKTMHGVMTIETFDDVSCPIPVYDSKGRCISKDQTIDGTPWYITAQLGGE